MVENGKETHNLTSDELKMAIENTESFKVYLDYWYKVKHDLIEKEYEKMKNVMIEEQKSKEAFWNIILAGIGVAGDYIESKGNKK